MTRPPSVFDVFRILSRKEGLCQFFERGNERIHRSPFMLRF